jgi:hypothetical protein
MTGNGLVRGVLVLAAASGVFAATAGAADEKDATPYVRDQLGGQ